MGRTLAGTRESATSLSVPCSARRGSSSSISKSRTAPAICHTTRASTRSPMASRVLTSPRTPRLGCGSACAQAAPRCQPARYATISSTQLPGSSATSEDAAASHMSATWTAAATPQTRSPTASRTRARGCTTTCRCLLLRSFLSRSSTSTVGPPASTLSRCACTSISTARPHCGLTPATESRPTSRISQHLTHTQATREALRPTTQPARATSQTRRPPVAFSSSSHQQMGGWRDSSALIILEVAPQLGRISY